MKEKEYLPDAVFESLLKKAECTSGHDLTSIIFRSECDNYVLDFSSDIDKQGVYVEECYSKIDDILTMYITTEEQKNEMLTPLIDKFNEIEKEFEKDYLEGQGVFNENEWGNDDDFLNAEKAINY